MSYARGKHPGAQWRKCDFQIHTPRDEQWSGLRSASNTEDVNVARKEWAEQFAKECVARGLGAIAITDHHDTVFIPVVQEAIERLGLSDSLWFYPGIEVTCNDASQCLLIFDPKTERSVLQRLFGGHINNIQEAAEQSVKAAIVSPCGKNIVEFIDGISKDSVLRAKSVALPHGGNSGDHRSVMKSQFQSRFQDLEADGVYIERPFEELHIGTLTILQGNDPQWGKRRRGVLATGDNRDAAFSRLGVHTCWIRLGEPTTEAIRQALLADEARITYAMPISPLQRILSMSVGSTMTGPNFAITFNEGANAFIGGRGSGKTSVLEYLRFALGRSSLDLAAPDKETGAREREMLRTTLKSGGVRVTLLRDGIEETWERRFDSMATITVSSSTQPPSVETINVEQAQTRFFARAFSQKQLSSLISDPKDADEQITGMAAAEVRVERQASLNEIERRRQEVRLAFEGIVLHWQHTQAFEDARRRATDVERRSTAMGNELEKAGLSADARQAIAEDTQYRSANRTLTALRSAVDLLTNKTTELRTATASPVPTTNETASFPEVQASREIVETLVTDVQQQLTQIEALIASSRQSLAAQQNSFDAKRQAHDKVQAAALEQQKSLDEQLKALASLTKEKEALATEIETLRAEVESRAKAQDELNQKIVELRHEVSNHRSILERAAARVEEMSGGLLRASVQTETMPTEYLEAFSDTCDNVRIQNYDARCKEMLQELLKIGGIGWDELVKIFFDLFHAKILAGAKAPNDQEIESLRRIFGSLTPAQYQGIYGRIDSPKIARLIGAVTTDYIAFSYSDRGTFIDFSQASPGQQAGALLTLLLNQEAGTLIIDQPEDDLDNRIIMDIVAQMRRAKTKRQMIFSTHNANVVVNGDADKIVVLRPAVMGATAGVTAAAAAAVKISIEVDGAIETPKVKDAITATLEGGERAFELRRRKYIS
jgi:chromosome segregation protein